MSDTTTKRCNSKITKKHYEMDTRTKQKKRYTKKNVNRKYAKIN